MEQAYQGSPGPNLRSSSAPRYARNATSYTDANPSVGLSPVSV